LDDLPADSSFARGTKFLLPFGGIIMLWVDLGGGSFAKVLFAWPTIAGLPGPNLVVTWIAFEARLTASLKIVNNVKATTVSAAGTSVITRTCSKYDGTLDLYTQKFFLTPETQQFTPAMEQWFWDDGAIPAPPAKLILPGGSVQIDGSLQPVRGGIQRRLVVQLDQTTQANRDQLPLAHTVQFKATDAFGQQLSIQTLVPTPPCVTSVSPLGSLGGFSGAGTFINPLGPDVANLLGQIAQTLQLIQTSILANQIGVAGSVSSGIVNARTPANSQKDGSPE
jgi:hypothetical protein